MAVLIRETRVLDGQEFKDVRVFKSDKIPISKEGEDQALRLDEYLSDFFDDLRKEVRNKNLLQLKGKSGVLELWYYVGRRLSFVDDTTIVHPADKKYIWRAIWHHANDLVPGESGTRAGTGRDHFLYCYRLAKFDKDFVMNGGNWRNWQDFFDSPILSNEIILEWFSGKAPVMKKLGISNWLRQFITLVRNAFQNIDMSFLTKKEILTKMDKVFEDFVEGQTQAEAQ